MGTEDKEVVIALQGVLRNALRGQGAMGRQPEALLRHDWTGGLSAEVAWLACLQVERRLPPLRAEFEGLSGRKAPVDGQP